MGQKWQNFRSLNKILADSTYNLFNHGPKFWPIIYKLLTNKSYLVLRCRTIDVVERFRKSTRKASCICSPGGYVIALGDLSLLPKKFAHLIFIRGSKWSKIRNKLSKLRTILALEFVVQIKTWTLSCNEMMYFYFFENWEPKAQDGDIGKPRPS